MAFRLILIGYFLSCGFLAQVNGQFEDLSDCLSGDFLGQFISCVFAQPENADFSSIPSPSEVFGDDRYDSAGTLSASRGLKASPNFDNAPRKYFMDLKMKQLGINENSFYHDVIALANTWSSGKSDESVVSRISRVNLRRFIHDEFTTRFSEHFTNIVEKAVYLRQATHKIRAYGRQLDHTEAFIDDTWCTILDGLNDGLCNMVKCLEQYPAAAFEDGLDWIQCFVTCNDLAPFATCAANLFQTSSNEACQRVDWFSDVLVGIITAALNRTHCLFEVEHPVNLTNPIVLTEGGQPEDISFKMYVPPGVLCLGPDPLVDPLNLGLTIVGYIFGFDVTCDVEMQLTSANWLDDVVPYLGALSDRTKCRVPNRASKQVAVGFHPAAVNNSAAFKITPQNWNDTFEIPLLPVVDHRKDGDITVNFTMKLYVQGEMRGDTVKFPVTVVDSDFAGPVECYSINDPHIMTFDGHYYNNFYQGAFYLYKHADLPYEVQVIYQPCESGNNNASCTCAAAVRSGDDVLVMDRCRRGPCETGHCDPSQEVILYTNGELTEGTHVFKMDGGLRHDIVLPHGTIVRMVTSNNLLNVWIVPGSYDLHSTSGLCGTYNGNSTDDLMLPDGSVYSGAGNGNGDQPKLFSEAWRVAHDDLLFYGSPKNDSFSPLKACHCTHVLYQGANCDCGRGVTTELCDFFMDGDYGANITAIMTSAMDVEDPGSYLDDIDLDESYDPDMALPEWGPIWTEPTADAFCVDLIRNSNNSMIQVCRRGMLPERFDDAIFFCKQDIRILDNTDWKYSAVDNAKYRCLNKLVHDTGTTAEELEVFVNGSCVNECNGKGQCMQGTCMCNAGSWGPDCRYDSSHTPQITNRASQLCDTRNQMCHFATVTGQHFSETIDIRCEVKNVEITSKGLEYFPRRKTTVSQRDVAIINVNQAVCPLPANGSYEISVAWRSTDNQVSSVQSAIMDTLMMPNRAPTIDKMESSSLTSFVYIAYDSACFECDISSNTCNRKQAADHCWIDQTCWAPGQTKPDDDCRYCDPANPDQWSEVQSEVCAQQMVDEDKDKETNRKDRILRGALGGCISALVVIVVIIIFCVTRNKDKKTKMTESEMMRGHNVMPRNGTVYYQDTMLKMDHAYENSAVVDDDEAATTGSYDFGYNPDSQLAKTVAAQSTATRTERKDTDDQNEAFAAATEPHLTTADIKTAL